MTENLHRLLALLLLLLLLMGGYTLFDRLWLGKYAFYQEHIEQLQDRLYRYSRLRWFIMFILIMFLFLSMGSEALRSVI